MKITNHFNITIPALSKPILQDLQKKWSWIKAVEQDTSPETKTVFQLGTYAENGEYVSSKTYTRLLNKSKDTFLGFQHALWLVEHQDEFPEFMALLGEVYIDFPGIVAVVDGGERRFPSLVEDDNYWDVRWLWTGRIIGSFGRVALAQGAELGASNLQHESLSPVTLSPFESQVLAKLSSIEKLLKPFCAVKQNGRKRRKSSKS